MRRVARYLGVVYRDHGTWGIGPGFVFRSASARHNREGAAGRDAGRRPVAPADLSVLIG